MTQTATVHTDGADIVYDFEGEGPLLLTIAGAGGEGHRYAGLSARLKDAYTVVRYDRRCCTRSTGNRDQPLDMGQQARDAVAIIRAMGAGKADVFGSSAGGSIVCEMVRAYPEVLSGAIIHEPAIQSVLPDGAAMIAFADAVEAKRVSEGTIPAMMLFASSLRGMPKPAPGTTPRPGLFSSPNVEFFMRQEFRNISYYKPDFAQMRASGVPIVACAGKLSEDVYYARTAVLLAEQVGCPFQLIEGHHLAYAADPETFATELRGMLTQLRAA